MKSSHPQPKSKSDSILNTPTPIDLNSIPIQSNQHLALHSSSPSVHFIPPRRLFNQQQQQQQQSVSDPSFTNSLPNNNYLRHSIRFHSPSKSDPFNDLSTNPLASLSKRKTLVASTPLQTSLKTSTTSSSLKSSFPTNININIPSSLRTHYSNTPPSSKIPISLNPNLSGGIKLGQARLTERLRINLISIILLYALTWTRTFAALISAINHRFPELAAPIYLLEWTIVFTLLFNILQAYYKLKTRPLTTHVDLPLTPQQIRGTPNKSTGFRKNNKVISSSSNPHCNTPRSTKLPPSPTSLVSHDPISRPLHHSSNHQQQSDPSARSKTWSTAILSQDPSSQSASHLFKRSTNLSNSLGHSLGPSGAANHLPSVGPDSALNLRLSQSVRKVSNSNSLQRLLQETLYNS